MCLCLCHMCVSAQGGQERGQNPLGLEFGAVGSHLAWVPGTEFRLSEEEQALLTTEPSLCFSIKGLNKAKFSF